MRQFCRVASLLQFHFVAKISHAKIALFLQFLLFQHVTPFCEFWVKRLELVIIRINKHFQPNFTYVWRLFLQCQMQLCKSPVVTNKIHWNAERIIETYRGRWTGTETFHRDGKQELGLEDCQLRSGTGQTRHTYCVFLAYSLLVRQLDKTSVSGRASVRLTTIGESCRALLRGSIRSMIGWIVEQLATASGNVSKRLETILSRLGLGSFACR